MDIETAFTYLGFSEVNYTTEYFRTYQKGETTLFVYQSLLYGEKRFSNTSGEFTGGLHELILFYYLTDTSSSLSEKDRLTLFFKKHPDSPIKYDKLKGVNSFSLYEILLEKGISYKNKTFNNIIQIEDRLHLMFLDEEKTHSKMNILGVVSYDLNTHESKTFRFSNLDRSLYFSNPSIVSDRCVIFNDIKEMLSFQKQFDENFFYVLVDDFNENIAKTLQFLLKGKSIQKTILAFPDSINGILFDLKYISVFTKMILKEKEGYLKISIQQSDKSDRFLERLKDFKTSIVKSSNGLDTSVELINIKTSTNIHNENVFLIEIALISNVLKGFLILASYYLIRDEKFKVIKPEKVFWNDTKPNSKRNVDRDFNLKIANLKKQYSFV